MLAAWIQIQQNQFIGAAACVAKNVPDLLLFV